MNELRKWDLIKEAIKDSFSTSMYKMLFQDVRPVYLTNEQVVLQVNEIGYMFLQDEDTLNYKKLKMIIMAHTSMSVKIRIILEGEDITKAPEEKEPVIDSLLDKIPDSYFRTQENEQKSELNEIDPVNAFEENKTKTKAETFFIEESNILSKIAVEPDVTNLERNYTFDNFFYSFENKKVIKACSVVVETMNDPKFNPLFIYGNSGIGKTHLINALGNEAKKVYPDKKILYVNATMFLEEYTNLFKGGISNLDATDYFKEKYYNLDVLIFDDIQILEGKESTLNEFFSIFEQLRFNKKMIVITSDKHPEEIAFEERLISRFLSGLTLELRTPDSDTKKQIFHHYALKEELKVDEKAVQIFIDNSQNVRALLGYINALRLYVINEDVNNGIFDVISAQEIVNTQSRNIKSYSAPQIIDMILNYFDLTQEELNQKSRKAHIVKTRQFIAYFLYEKLDMSYTAIARHIGVKEHSTALRAVNKIKNEHNYVKYKDDYLKLSQMLNR